MEHEIINDAGFLDALEDVCNRALTIRNMMVKYMISGENRIKVNVIAKLDELAQIERHVLERLIQNMQDCHKSGRQLQQIFYKVLFLFRNSIRVRREDIR